MASHEQTCYTCWSTFYTSGWAVTECPTCQQTKAILKSQERQARQAQDAQREAQWQAEQMQREQARIAAQHTQALVNAENERIAAINYQTQIIMESSITEKQAYDRGYNYIDSEYPYGNPLNLNLCVFLNGNIYCQHENAYTTPRLDKSFRKGIDARAIWQFPPNQVHQILLGSAKQAGKENAEGTLPSHFTLYTGVSLDGKSFPTYDSFHSNFSKVLDEKTGELKMTWNEPFTGPDDAEFNQAYLDGVNEVHWVVNTPEQMNYRLRIEVPKLKAERETAKSIKRLDTIFKLLIAIFPLLALFILWQITSGWVTFFSFIAVPFIWKFLEKKHDVWQIENNKYLRS